MSKGCTPGRTRARMTALSLAALLAVAAAPAFAQDAPPGTVAPIAVEEEQALPGGERPDTVRLAVLGDARTMNRAARVAVLLNDYRRRRLESRMGMQLELANVSRANTHVGDRDVITYRPGYLRPALLMAEAIPGEQSVQPMGADRLRRAGVDVEILVGREAP